MFSKEKLAYLAGVVDGEGCITLTKFYRKDVRNDVWANIQIALTDSAAGFKVLGLFKKYFGGYLKARNTKGVNQKNIYFWRITSQKARICAELLLPYLIIKKRQAEIVIEYQKNVRNKSWRKGLRRWPTLPKEHEDKRNELLKEIRLLNKRGT